MVFLEVVVSSSLRSQTKKTQKFTVFLIMKFFPLILIKIPDFSRISMTYGNAVNISTFDNVHQFFPFSLECNWFLTFNESRNNNNDNNFMYKVYKLILIVRGEINRGLHSILGEYLNYRYILSLSRYVFSLRTRWSLFNFIIKLRQLCSRA